MDRNPPQSVSRQSGGEYATSTTVASAVTTMMIINEIPAGTHPKVLLPYT